MHPPIELHDTFASGQPTLVYAWKEKLAEPGAQTAGPPGDLAPPTTCAPGALGRPLLSCLFTTRCGSGLQDLPGMT